MARSEVGAHAGNGVAHQPARFIKVAFLLWSLTPTLWIATFLALVLCARIALGEWPHPRIGIPINPDYQPATFGSGSRIIHGELLSLLWPLALMSPLWLLANNAIFDASQRRTRTRMLLLFGVSYFGLLGIVFDDPWGLVGWAFD